MKMIPFERRRLIAHWLLSAIFAFAIRFGVPETLLAQDGGLLVPSAKQLPRWRGFNLLGKFDRDWSNDGYREQDFQIINELGFNFVRLPIDFRTLLAGENENRFHERQLSQLDQAIAWGKKYHIHVCLNFHRAPGFNVAESKEKNNLWTDAKPQAAAISHWQTLARRYRDVPSKHLSFNLFNEPVDGTQEQIVSVTKRVVGAIRKEDPDRLIIVDGFDYATKPVEGLVGSNVAQSLHCYAPMSVSHYQAEWMDQETYPVPQWPQPRINGYLYGQQRSDLDRSTMRPLKIQHSFTQPTRLRLRVDTVSSTCRLVVHANDRVVWDHVFRPGPGAGAWKKSVYSQRWKIYENVYDRDYVVDIPPGTKDVQISVDSDGWILLGELGIEARTPAANVKQWSWKPEHEWGKPAPIIRSIVRSGELLFTADEIKDRHWLWKTQTEPWASASRRYGVGVMVGEFGCYNKTPHDVTLAWMEDCLINFRQAGMGWALWNLRGPFGILDSQRKDVDYENYRGHKLDRKMLQLLSRY